MSRFSACLFISVLGLAGCAEGGAIDPSGSGAGSSTGPGGQGGSGGDTSTTSSTNATSTSSGPSCSESPCKLVEPQCGCDVGEQCTIGGDLQRTCAPEGTAGPGNTCSESVSCGTGSLCVGFGNGPLTCHEFCETDAECAPPGGRCVYSLDDGSGSTVPNLQMCSTSCNILNGAGCEAAGTACRLQLLTGDDVPFTNCFNAGTVVYPNSCTTNPDNCVAGSVCWPSSGSGNLCFQWCNVNAPTCPNGTTCTAVDVVEGTPLVLGGISYGLCSG